MLYPKFDVDCLGSFMDTVWKAVRTVGKAGSLTEELIKHQKDDFILDRSGGWFRPTMATIHLENCTSDRVTATKGEGVLSD